MDERQKILVRPGLWFIAIMAVCFIVVMVATPGIVWLGGFFLGLFGVLYSFKQPLGAAICVAAIVVLAICYCYLRHRCG